MDVSGVILGLLAVLIATSYILYCYGNVRRQHVIVTIATLLAWYLSFSIVFMLPVDVSMTSYRQCLKDRAALITTTTPANVSSDTQRKPNITSNINTTAKLSLTFDPLTSDCILPWTNLPDEVLTVFWKVVYWSSQILTWLILPMMQSYSNAGDFGVLGKIKSALIANAIYYGTYLVIFLICLIYVATRPDVVINAENIKVVGITASNTWGLFLLVLLFGYGLVDIPRSMWDRSMVGYTLQQTYFHIAKLSTEASEANEKYEDTLEEVRRVAEKIKYNHPYRQYVDTILSKCPDDWRKTLRRNDDFVDYNSDDQTIPTEKALIKLHLAVITAVRNYHRTQSQRSRLVQQAYELDDVVSNEASTNRYFKRSTGKYSGMLRLLYSPRLEWWWKVLLRPLMFKAVAISLALFSTMVVWSECVFFIKSPVLSLFAIFINEGRKHFAYISIELTSWVVIGYLCVCAYRTIFKIRFFNYIYISSNHQTDENSLLFSGMMLCRLTPPLCLNFLSLIHLDSHVIQGVNEETAYTKIMGHMDVIHFIASGFNIYFPIAIVLLCIATLLKLGSRLLHCIGFEQFIGDADMTQELVDEGKNLVLREKRKLQRDQEREARSADWKKTLANSRARDTDADVTRQQEAHDSSDSSQSKTKQYGTERKPDKKGNPDWTAGALGASTSRVELITDEQPIDFDQVDTNRFDYQPSRAKPPSRLFDDV